MKARTDQTCPSCGCPARRVIARKAVVHVEVNADGSLGDVVRAYGATDFSTAEYTCSGGHRWPFQAVPEEGKHA